MTPGELLGASRREHELYGELVAVYGALEGLLTDEQAAPDHLAVATREAARVGAALAALDATLAPARAGGSVPADVAALWQASAALAVRAAAKNRALLAEAVTKRDRVASRRRALVDRRRQSAGYALTAPRRIGVEARA